jgi:hypothetical protein
MRTDILADILRAQQHKSDWCAKILALAQLLCGELVPINKIFMLLGWVNVNTWIGLILIMI